MKVKSWKRIVVFEVGVVDLKVKLGTIGARTLRVELLLYV